MMSWFFSFLTYKCQSVVLGVLISLLIFTFSDEQTALLSIMVSVIHGDAVYFNHGYKNRLLSLIAQDFHLFSHRALNCSMAWLANSSLLSTGKMIRWRRSFFLFVICKDLSWIIPQDEFGSHAKKAYANEFKVSEAKTMNIKIIWYKRSFCDKFLKKKSILNSQIVWKWLRILSNL